MLTDGLEWCGLLVDYCDVFISCLDSHSDGTHSLQRIHCWASDVMLHFSKSDEETNSSTSWLAWGWAHFHFLNDLTYFFKSSLNAWRNGIQRKKDHHQSSQAYSTKFTFLMWIMAKMKTWWTNFVQKYTGFSRRWKKAQMIEKVLQIQSYCTSTKRN